MSRITNKYEHIVKQCNISDYANIYRLHKRIWVVLYFARMRNQKLVHAQ